MKQTTFFEDSGCVWLKGNVHCHITCSDGHLAPEDALSAYQQHGFDWMVITDHNIFTNVHHQSKKEFLLLNGIELTTGWGPRIHVNVFWDNTFSPFSSDEKVSLSNPEETVSMLQSLKEQGCFLTLNHPHWSLLEPDYIDCGPFDAIEVYNHSTYRFDNMGLGTIFWDQMLRRGYSLWGTASDDNHNGAALDSIGCDSFGGFTVVKARARTESAILEALFHGSFYASAGPDIYDFYIENSTATIHCSPCERIWFSVDGRRLKTVTGSYLTTLSVPLPPEGHYIRAECMDAAGRSAYTNPLFLK